ncbi:PASTA domain-containing protein [Actinoplanes sp. NPDC051851]|uniref:PASTA domain-containing protein n=1 Tax=Actinoplanes sp. NPDC051851 TaxID=3154753 RepID=UPI00341E75FB
MPDDREQGADTGAPRPAETRPMPAADSSPPSSAGAGPGASDPSGDETRVQRNQPSGRPRSEDTRTTVASWDPDPRPNDAAWTGRAAVRAPRPDGGGGGAYPERGWDTGSPSESEGRWWMPILVGSVALVLLALLVIGLALIVRNTGGAESPTPTPTATVTETATGTTEPSAAETTTPPPVTTTATTEPVSTEITVPALRGMPLNDAQAALQRMGLTYRIITRESDVEPGVVIDSDPAEGQVVPSDTRITLVVAVGSTANPTPTTTAVPTTGVTTEPVED